MRGNTKKLIVMIGICLLPGCATLDTTLDILDILVPTEDIDEIKPVPVCNAGSVGVEHEWKVCLEFSDGSFRWRWLEINNDGYGGIFSPTLKNEW